MKLRHQILAGYIALFALLALGLAAFFRVVVARHIAAQQRDAVASLARVGIDVLLPSGQPKTRTVLQAKARAFAQRTGLRVTIIAPDGVVLADSERDPSLMENHGLRPEVVGAHRDGWGWAVRHSATLGFDMLYVAQADHRREYVVRLAKPLAELKRLDAHLFYTLATALALAFVIGAVVSIRIAGNLSDILSHLARVARTIGAGDLSVRASVIGNNEAADLAQALNEMASRLQENSIQLAHRTGEVQAILRHMSDGVLLVDSQLRVAMCNPAAARMLGFDPETAVGQDVLRLSGIYDLADALQRTSQLSSTTEVEFMTRHGEERIIQASVTPGGGQRPGQQWVVAVLRDVTHLRHLERVRQDFVASAGHELRTPVAAIRSLAEALAAGGLSDPETGPEFVRQIIDNTERLERLVDDMLELARVETVAHRELCPVHVKSVIEKAVERLRVQAESAGLRLVVSVGDDLWARGDGEDIETAIVNLLDNAIKYAADGGSVEIEAAADDGEVLIRVVDHGPGIPLAERQRIFERFYRLDKARSRQMGGTGLGLSIVKHAVEKMGSRVWIEDTPGGGATFVIALPTLD